LCSTPRAAILLRTCAENGREAATEQERDRHMTRRAKCRILLVLLVSVGGCANLTDKDGKRISLREYDSVVVERVTIVPEAPYPEMVPCLQASLELELLASEEWLKARQPPQRHPETARAGQVARAPQEAAGLPPRAPAGGDHQSALPFLELHDGPGLHLVRVLPGRAVRPRGRRAAGGRPGVLCAGVPPARRVERGAAGRPDQPDPLQGVQAQGSPHPGPRHRPADRARAESGQTLSGPEGRREGMQHACCPGARRKRP